MQNNVTVKLSETHFDDRGFFQEIFRESIYGPIKQVSLSKSLPGVVRGPHLHHHTTDYLYLMSGTLLVKMFKDNPDESETITIVLSYKGEMRMSQILVIPAGYYHTYVNPSKNEPAVVLYGHDAEYDFENPDVVIWDGEPVKFEEIDD